MENSLYLGPFLICKTHVVEKVFEVFGCPKCQNSNRAKFCSICGSKMEIIKITKEVAACNGLDEAGVKVDQLFELNREHRSLDQHLFGANHRGPRRFFLDDSQDGVIFDKAPDFEGEKNWFLEKYSEEIEILKKAYDSVEIKWGMIGDN